MEIIARLQDWQKKNSGAIVKLTDRELAIVAGGGVYAAHEHFKPGDIVDVHADFILSQNVRKGASESIKLPGILRAFADTLETVKPQIDAIVNSPVDSEAEVPS